MATATITLKTDTTANWNSTNRILALNEPALERTTDGYINMKLGDGHTAWKSLPYVFELKTLEEIGASSDNNLTEAKNQVTLAKAELAKCVAEYNKAKEVSDNIADRINTLCSNAESATNRANAAASVAEGLNAQKVGINDNVTGTDTTYSSEKIEKIFKSVYRPKEWGVRFQLYPNGTSTPAGERLGDAIGLISNVGTDTVSAYNDFDYLTPWKSRRVNGYWEDKKFVITAVEGEPNFALDGSNGNVYAERHLFYYKYVFNNNNFEIWISDEQLEGYSIPERFINLDGSVMDTYYYPCYKIGLDASGKPVSYSGLNTMLARSYSSYKSLLRTQLGNSYHLETTKDRQINELLFFVEFATLNSQAIMTGASALRYNQAADKATVATTNGNTFICASSVADAYCIGQSIVIGTTQNGSEVANQRRIVSIDTYDASNKAIKFDGAAVNVAVGNFISSRSWFSGGTDSVKTPSGSPISNTDSKYQCRYRYVEDLWGNQWSIMGDVLVNEHQTYVCKDPSKYADSVTSDYEMIGYVNASSDGYIRQLGWDAEHPSVRLPIVSGGSSTTYLCDYYWQAAGLRVVYAGGNVLTGVQYGLYAWSCYDAVSYAAWFIGGRLSHTA